MKRRVASSSSFFVGQEACCFFAFKPKHQKRPLLHGLPWAGELIHTFTDRADHDLDHLNHNLPL